MEEVYSVRKRGKEEDDTSGGGGTSSVTNQVYIPNVYAYLIYDISTFYKWTHFYIRTS